MTVEVDDSQRRTVAEIEADRAERAEARAERYEERAGKRGTEARAPSSYGGPRDPAGREQ